MFPLVYCTQGLEPLASQLDDMESESVRLRLSLEETADRLLHTQAHAREREEFRTQQAESSRAALEAARKGMEEAQVDATERSRERSARAAMLNDLLAEQGSLLAER